MAGKYVNTERGRRWQNADGTYAYVKPGGGAQFGAGFIEFLAPGTNQRTAELDQKNKPLTKNPVPPSQPEGEDTVYSPIQPRIERKPGPFDPGYRKPNPTMDVIPEAAAEPEKRAGDIAFVPDSIIDTGNGGGGGNRNSERTNANGIVQRGTDMSRSFNDLLATTNTSGYQPYSSNQLPTTQANPFSAQPPKTQSFNTEAESVTGNSLADFGGDGSAAFASSRETTANDTFNPDATRIEGGSSRKPGGSLSDALNDKAGINSYMSKFSSGDQERAANRAFLDTKGSMEGLRAKEAVNGVVYAQGQHYVSGKSGDDAAVAIDRSAARDISNGKETASGASQKAQDLLAKKTADVVAAVKQSPTLLEQGAKDGAFQQDKPMSATMPSDIGGKTEYYSNNDNVTEPFGGPKGYKSGFKRIDTSMPNPFGG